MIELLIAFGCGAATAVLWRRLFVRRATPPSVSRTRQPACAWGREYDVPTYQRRRHTRP